jgi:hypothetical protein
MYFTALPLGCSLLISAVKTTHKVIFMDEMTAWLFLAFLR